ncbi:MAG: hypothetical protein KGJ84_15005 [Elusimicrobia bacterium]|nr:hypothetical protein [Elusimicrobiota bacterium]
MTAVPKQAAPALPAYDPEGPRIEFGVSLPPAIEQAVREVAPGFKIWRQTDYPPETIRRYGFSLQSAPSAVFGDFNGDGILDAALAGRDRDGPMVIVILSRGNSYHASLLYPKEAFQGWRAKYVQGKPLPRKAFDLLTPAPKGSAYDLGGDMYTKQFALPQEGFTDRPLDVYTLKNWKSPKLYWWDSAASQFRSGEVFEDR